MTMVPLVGKQLDSLRLATCRLNIWEGSVRSSKTVCSLMAWLDFVRTGPAGNLVMIGKTERTLKRNIIDPLTDWLGAKRCKLNSGTGELMLCGRRIYIAGANDERAQDKIRGLTLAGAYVDELSLMPEAMFAMLRTRLSVEGAALFATSNPDNPNHWLMRDFLSKALVWLKHNGTIERLDPGPDQPDVARLSFRLPDNPTLPAEYLAALQAEFTGLWRARFIDGLWVLAEGSVYDSFDPTPGAGHVVSTLPEMQEWVVAIDHGTTNPFVALLIGLGVDDRLYIAREYRWDSKARNSYRKTQPQYSQALREWLTALDPPSNEPGPFAGAREPAYIYVDPSAASFIVQLHNDGWSGVRGANNEVADGIRWVSSLLAADRLKIHESCEGISEKVGYAWDEKAALRGEEKPVKQKDHFPDAERYGVMGTMRWWRHWLTVDPGEAEAA